MRNRAYSKHYTIYGEQEGEDYKVYSQFAADRLAPYKSRIVTPAFNNFQNFKNGKTTVLVGTVGAIRDNTIYLLTGDKVIPVEYLSGKLPELNNKIQVTGYYNKSKRVFIALSYTPMEELDKERVELHCATNNSQSYSILRLEDYVGYAAKRGYQTIAITDKMSVHSFPALEAIAREFAIKPIYGVEMTVGIKQKPVMGNIAQNISIDQAKYAIVDVETTGLNVARDEIVEISVLIVKNWQIKGRYTTLVKPTRKMTAGASEITGITDKDLANAPTKEQIKPHVKRLLKDCIIVAHNAKFDMAFLEKTFGTFNNPVIDSLKLARTLLAGKRKRLNLQSLAKYFSIKVDVAHRAEADVETLWGVFAKLLKLAQKQNITTLEDLNKLTNQSVEQYDEYTATVLVKNQRGLSTLYKLLTEAYTKYFTQIPIIPIEELYKHRNGLLLGTGLPNSTLYELVKRNASTQEIVEEMEKYDYIEVCPVDATEEPNTAKAVFQKICVYAEQYKKPIVMVSNARYLRHEHKLCYQAFMSSKRVKSDVEGNYHFRTSKELKQAALEFAVGVEQVRKMIYHYPARIAKLIQDIKIVPKEFITPGIANADKVLTKRAMEGLKRHYGDNPHEVIKSRFDRELKAIISNKFSELYVVAYLATQISLKMGYSVGSRGSVGSSLVAYLMGITEVNPLPPHYHCPECHYVEFPQEMDKQLQITESGIGYDLPPKKCPKCGRNMQRLGFNIPFEAFMGINNNRVPDIDLNFSDEIQTDVHREITRLFGEEHVLRAGTVLRVKPRTAMAMAAEFAKKHKISEEFTPVIVDQIVEAKLGTGQHPGGLLIFNKKVDINNYTPIQYPANNSSRPKISHIEYDYLHDAVMKLDALGHLTPSMLKQLHILTGVDPSTVDMSDPDVMELFRSTESLGIDLRPVTSVGTIGISEFGTKFVRRILEMTKPRTFEELVKICGLAHGTNVWNDNAEFYIKSDQASLKDVISVRDDIFVNLVKAGVEPQIAFEIMERVKKGKGLLERHIKALQGRVPQWYIESANKIQYLFPKAHASAYTISIYRMSWYKIHYPLAFYAGILSKRSTIDAKYYLMSPDKLEPIILTSTKDDFSMKELMCLEMAYEAKKRGYDFLPPHVSLSHNWRFIVDNNNIRLPLSSIKGIGEKVAKNIVEAREQGQFVSVQDFIKRSNVNKRVVQLLEDIGALKNLPR